MNHRRTTATMAGCVLSCLLALIGCAAQRDPETRLDDAIALHDAPLITARPAGALVGTPQTVPVTVQPNASQAVSIPAPANNDFSVLPLVTSANPNLVVASTQYSGDQKYLVVSAMNTDTTAPTTGQLAVAGWGTFEATVQPNPSQLVLVDLPAGYSTSALPTVSSNSGNLYLFSATYDYTTAGTPQLALSVGNPFPNMPSSGSLNVDW